MSLRQLIIERMREAGPLTVAEFMRLALYEPEFGYYARRAQRSGRAGDFYTSVDVGPLFGSLLAVQIAEMWRLLGAPSRIALVEAGAGNGRLARDILDELAASYPSVHAAIELSLVEISPPARAAQVAGLGPHASHLVASGSGLPSQFTGILYANELLDAMPTHVVTMTATSLQEVFVEARADRFSERLASPSTPALERYLDRVGLRLQPGWRAEINLAAVDWIADAVRRLDRGFLILVDYGHEAGHLYSAAHAGGTLTAFHRHGSSPAAASCRGASWLAEPGEQDLTAHVDFTSLRLAAEEHGAVALGLLDQTYFLMGLGLSDRVGGSGGNALEDLRRRMRARSLVLPGGLGSTHKVLLLGKRVGEPALRGCSAGIRLT